MTGDEILESRREDVENKTHTWERKVLQFKQWVIQKKGKSENTARTGAMTVRGFFAFHYVKLEFRSGEKKRIGERKRLREDYKFTLADLQKMSQIANLREQYVIVVGKSFGMRAGDFSAIKRGDLQPYIDRQPPISIGEFSTQKESVKAYPFIDRDAKPIIKLMLEQMTREGKTSPEDLMLPFKRSISLTRVLKRVAKKAGIESGRKQIRFHCLRKFLIDRLSSIMSESKWKQIVGKQISEGAYVSAESLQQDYARATPETCFKKEETDKVDVFLANLRISDPETHAQLMKRFDGLGQKANLDEIVKIIEEMRECENGNCQRIVEETELAKYLQQGWHVVTALPSGKIVIDNT